MNAPVFGVVPTITNISCAVLFPANPFAKYVRSMALLFSPKLFHRNLSIFVFRETAAAPSFVTAAPIKFTHRLGSAASCRPPVNKLSAKMVMQSSREFPLIVTGLTQIAVYWPTVDFVLIGIMFKAKVFIIIELHPICYLNNPCMKHHY